MNVVVVGLGSMGKRRLRLIQELYPEFVICGVDGREDRRNEASATYGIETYDSLDKVRMSVDCAFICTSPLSHASIITECLNRGWNVFTELNLVDDRYEQNMKLAQDRDCVLFLSSTFFYRDEIRYIRKKIVPEKKWNYIYHVGQYLPDWHPWDNYQEFFIGDKRTNGCREIMAIELPWLTTVFGDIVKTNVLSDKITDLNILYNDNYMIILEHVGGNKGVLVIDVVTPHAVRKLEVYAENKYLSWEGQPDSLYEYNEVSKKLEKVEFDEKAENIEGYQSFVVENAYRNEIREFFEVVMDGKDTQYGFEKDKKILEIIDSLGA